MNNFILFLKSTHHFDELITFIENITLQLFFYKYTIRYIDRQKELEELFSSMQDFVIRQDFQRHIKDEGYGLATIEGTLSLLKNDISKTECPIVFAGEHTFYFILFI